jgi:outer membrane receptor protein involved in Fe transport
MQSVAEIWLQSISEALLILPNTVGTDRLYLAETCMGRKSMRSIELKTCASALAIGAALAVAAPAFAQDAKAAAPAKPAAAADAGGLDEIVVTASGRDKSQLNSSVSVTSVNADIIKNFQPSSEAEVFRLIPGIQVAGTSGPGGNSNIAVRGLPVATGGAPYVQIQEDGLPTVLFGDIQFGNNDYWTHFDATVANVEAIRGGTVVTHASQAPGAVINYISQTGKQDGGFLELQKGVNYDETKVNFRYGGAINDSLRFHIGGYFKTGGGPLHAGFNVSESVQVKGNITKEFEDGKGYFRLLFKFADTQEPNYTGAPAFASVSGGKVSNIRPFTNFDGRKDSNYSIYNREFTILNRDGVLERVKMDGITTKAKTVGAQFHREFGDNITVDNNLRWTKMSGGFASPFLGVDQTANSLGKVLTVNGAPINGTLANSTVRSIRYASGPNAGREYTAKYLDNNVNVRTNIRDIGSFANDFSVNGKFDADWAKITARAGLFYMNQKIVMDWHVNKSTRELSGNNPSQLDFYTAPGAAGVKLTQAGISGYNNNWGNCCARDYDLSYTDTAPSFGLDLDADQFTVDASIRFDRVKASGGGTQGGSEFIVNSNGVNIAAITSNSAREVLNYARRYSSWTAGALYKANSDTSVFVRASKGNRFNADRQTFSGKFEASGALNLIGLTPSVDVVNQYELGVKNRGDLGGAGRYTFELTLLKGDFKRSDYEPTVTAQCRTGGCIIDTSYKTKGAELYATYRNGGFLGTVNATYTKAKRAGAGSTVFSRADGIPDLSYTLTGSYDVGEYASVGLDATGVTSETDGTNSYPGGTTFGAFVRVYPIENLEVGMQVYNLFNKFDLRGNGGISDLSSSPAVIGGAPVIGRTFTASIKYKF